MMFIRDLQYLLHLDYYYFADEKNREFSAKTHMFDKGQWKDQNSSVVNIYWLHPQVYFPSITGSCFPTYMEMGSTWSKKITIYHFSGNNDWFSIERTELQK